MAAVRKPFAAKYLNSLQNQLDRTPARKLIAEVSVD
jgi:hypothetical protein